MTKNNLPFACPIDYLPLDKTEQGFRCSNGHSYDTARQGYVNLLPVQFKPSKDPGDVKSMVAARRDVMTEGIFKRVADQLTDSIAEYAQSTEEQSPTLIDAGCGEGYYTNQIYQRLQGIAETKHWSVIGIDISKSAILSAVKRYPMISWAVANNKRLPIIPGRANIITSLFGFETWLPWSQLQNPAQLVVVVSAGPNHLIELRKRIYDNVQIHEPVENIDSVSAGYQLIDEQSLTYTNQINRENLLYHLLLMTPHHHKVQSERIDSIKYIVDTEITVNTVTRVYRNF